MMKAFLFGIVCLLVWALILLIIKKANENKNRGYLIAFLLLSIVFVLILIYGSDG